MAERAQEVLGQLRKLVAIRRKQLELMHILLYEADEAIERIHARHYSRGMWYGLNLKDCPELPHVVQALRVAPDAEIETIESALKVLKDLRLKEKEKHDQQDP